MKITLITPVDSLHKSLEFYRSLGFKIEDEDDLHFASAKGLLIEINPDRYVRAGIKLYHDHWDPIIKKLSQITNVNDTKEAYILSDLSGSRIYLSKNESPVLPETSQLSSILGNFAGLSIEATDPNKTISIYQSLGFEISSGSIDQGWVSLQNKDGFAISVMKPNSCPHLFFNPSMTFFNGKNNPSIIEKIRNSGISIAEEITIFNKEGIVDNIVLRDGGGYGFFIFND